MDEKISKAFGQLIAFVIPGFVTLWGMSYIVRDLNAWLGIGTYKDGQFLFALIASIGLGVFVSGLRFIVFDKVVFGSGRLGVPAPVEDAREAALRKDHQATYDDWREQHYRFYQFYSNTAVALVLSFVAWLVAGAGATVSSRWIVGTFLFAEGVLSYSARDSITKYRMKRKALIDSAAGGDSGDERRRDEAPRRNLPEGRTEAQPPEAGEAGAAASSASEAREEEVRRTR
jgi:hypothetical protein